MTVRELAKVLNPNQFVVVVSEGNRSVLTFSGTSYGILQKKVPPHHWVNDTVKDTFINFATNAFYIYIK